MSTRIEDFTTCSCYSYRALVQLDDLAISAGGLEGLLGTQAKRAVLCVSKGICRRVGGSRQNDEIMAHIHTTSTYNALPHAASQCTD